MTGSTTTPGGDRVTSLVSIRNKNSENPNNFVVLSVEHGCGGYERRCSFSAPFGEGDVVSKKLESDHVRPVGSELRTRLRDRVGGTALTDLYATGTCISQSRSRLPLGRDRESAPERGDITDMSALRRDDKRAWLRLSTVCGPKEGRRHQTSCEPEGSQLSCPTGALQDGRHTPTEGHSTPRGLDDKGRSERRLFFYPSQQPRQEIPEISLARQDVPVQLPTVRTSVGPVDLYQGHKASSDYSQNTGHENNHLHRRHPGNGTKQGTGSGAHRVPDISVGEPWVHRQSTEIFDRPHTGNRIPGSRCRLRFDGAQITGFKDQEHPVRCQSAAPNGSAHGSGSVKTARQVDPCNPCNEGSPPLLQTPPSMPASCLAASAGLLPALPSNKRGERGFELVGHSPNFMEREVHHSRQSRSNDRDGCLQHRLGCPVRQPADGRTVVSHRGENAHQLPRASGSNLGN